MRVCVVGLLPPAKDILRKRVDNKVTILEKDGSYCTRDFSNYDLIILTRFTPHDLFLTIKKQNKNVRVLRSGSIDKILNCIKKHSMVEK